MTAGVLGLIAIVFGMRVMNRLVALPPDTLPDLSQVPRATLAVLLLASALFAGLIEEAAFRGYMQKPIEERYGLAWACLVTGTMFALAHLSFTWVLWPYYVAVQLIYGSVTYVTKSILLAVALHALGNTYSNFDLWLHGRSDWQTGLAGTKFVWETGADWALWSMVAGFVVCAALAVWATKRLAVVVASSGPAFQARDGS
jgi:membrane protease YdiL (CAAX protease family)